MLVENFTRRVNTFLKKAESPFEYSHYEIKYSENKMQRSTYLQVKQYKPFAIYKLDLTYLKSIDEMR